MKKCIMKAAEILCLEKPQFLGAFAEFRKATISFVMSVCPSVRMEVVPHRTDFDET